MKTPITPRGSGNRWMELIDESMALLSVLLLTDTSSCCGEQHAFTHGFPFYSNAQAPSSDEYHRVIFLLRSP